MTDYFALLKQPRAAWLDPDELQQAFHARTLRAHPDARGSEMEFAELNQAYQVLRDPKRRLHHLLTLAGHPPLSQNTAVPGEIENLFPVVATLTHGAQEVQEKAAHASNALSRSLLKSQIAKIQTDIEQTLRGMDELEKQALAKLQTVGAEDFANLHALYLSFSYLGRWIAELKEKRLQLAEL